MGPVTSGNSLMYVPDVDFPILITVEYHSVPERL
jgi:hypothetical protein